jgi:hypothetical protein
MNEEGGPPFVVRKGIVDKEDLRILLQGWREAPQLFENSLDMASFPKTGIEWD